MLVTLTALEAFTESFVHDRHILLGREMLPFCLRHLLLLRAARSPLFCQAGAVQEADILTAIVVCSTPSDREFFDACRQPSPGWADWWMKNAVFDSADVVSDFHSYVKDFFPAFPFLREDGADSDEDPDYESTVPGILVTAARALPALGREAVMNIALGEVFAWSMALAEASGNKITNLMTTRQIESFNRVERMYDEHERRRHGG